MTAILKGIIIPMISEGNRNYLILVFWAVSGSIETVVEVKCALIKLFNKEVLSRSLGKYFCLFESNAIYILILSKVLFFIN